MNAYWLCVGVHAMKPCKSCNGTGEIRSFRWTFDSENEIQYMQEITEPCKKCRGTGIEPEEIAL